MYQRALQGKKKAWGLDHTSTLVIVNNLANLYKTQGKLVEAKQMFQRALRGYETAIGTDNITTFIPALNTLWGLGSLFEHQADYAKAIIIYSKAFAEYEKVVGPDHPRCQSLHQILQDLDTRTKIEATKRTNEPASNPSRVSGSDSKGALSTSRRHKLLKKLGIR